MIERLPEDVRVRVCDALKPVVFPVHDFVERWYHTDASVRASKTEDMSWQLLGKKAKKVLRNIDKILGD